MSETRTTFDPFEGKPVEIRNDLVLRLRGKYATGPTLPNGEPEFGWRKFPTPPIQHEAADVIERLRAPFAHVDSLDWDFLERLLIMSMRHQQDSQVRIWIEAIKAARATLTTSQRAEK